MIRIEMRIQGSSPSGRVTAAGGDTRAFEGWVGLVSAVEDLAGSGSDSDADPFQQADH